MKILSFGSLNIDYSYTLDHIVAPGETISSSGLNVACGGKGLNQSVALKKAGAIVWHAGMIGKDGEMLRQFLEESGVNTSLLKTHPDEKSGHTIIQIEEKSGQNCIIVSAGTNGLIDKDFIDHVAGHFDKGDFAVFQNEISNVDYAMKRCRERGMRIVFNPSPMTAALAASDIFKYVDDLFINEVEGEQMTGTSDPELILRVLKEKYPDINTILTLGAHGSMTLKDERLVRQKAYACEAVDTTAAGDTFSGYATALLSKGSSIEEALDIASRASSLAVRKMGAAPSIPYYDEVMKAKF